MLTNDVFFIMLWGGKSRAVNTISAGVDPRFESPLRLIKSKKSSRFEASRRQVAVMALMQKLTAIIARGE
ncbi:hypothetical protein D3C80_625410 [compost metagenome]